LDFTQFTVNVYELPLVACVELGLIEHWYPLGLLVIDATSVSVCPPIGSCSLFTLFAPLIEETDDFICQLAPSVSFLTVTYTK
jgi:hypothetical protein